MVPKGSLRRPGSCLVKCCTLFSPLLIQYCFVLTFVIIVIITIVILKVIVALSFVITTAIAVRAVIGYLARSTVLKD